MLVLSGLAQQNAAPMGDEGGDHARSLACFLTGTHPLKTDGANIRAGVSIDQVAAFQIGHQTRLPSLELGIDPSAQAGLATPAIAAPTRPISPGSRPTCRWPRRSTPGRSSTACSAGGWRCSPGRAARASATSKSILDFVREDARQLQSQLGINDRRKIEEYLSAVREIERGSRVESGDAASRPAPGVARPAGIPADLREHIRLMLDLLALRSRPT